MRKISTLIVACFLMFTQVGNTQDLHFTMFDFSPMYLNPALAGAYSGTYRIGGIARQQWSVPAGTSDAFRTGSIFIDSPIIRGIRKQDWIGVGIGFDYDQVGEVSVKSSLSRIGASYHLSLDKKQTNIFTFGVQLENASRTLDLTDARSGAALANAGRWATLNDDPSLLALVQSGGSQNGEPSLDGTYRDVIFGLGYRSKIGRTNSLSLGLALSQLFNPDQSVAQGRFELPTKITFHGQYRFLLVPRLTMTPGVIVQKQSNTWDRGVQTVFGYLFKPEKGLVLNGGLGFRAVNASALQFILGAEIKDLRFGLSYDMQLAGDIATASNTVGGFEIGVAYVGRIYKKPKVKPLIICPRL